MGVGGGQSGKASKEIRAEAEISLGGGVGGRVLGKRGRVLTLLRYCVTSMAEVEIEECEPPSRVSE